MRKKLLLLLLFIFAFNSIICFSDDFDEEEASSTIYEAVSQSLDSNKQPDINARSGIVIDFKTGRILYEKNAYIKRPMASTTKIMTAIVAIENGYLEDKVTISK